MNNLGKKEHYGKLESAAVLISSFNIMCLSLYSFRNMMSKQGLNSLFPMEDIAVMGIWELLPHLNQFRVCHITCILYFFRCIFFFL